MQPNLFNQASFQKKQHTQEHLAKLSTPTPALCACCRRKAGPAGISAHPYMLWVCKDWECKDAAKRIIEMPTPDFDELEHEALQQGMRAGWAYMDSIDKDNVFDLDAHQAVEFGERIIDGFGCHLRARLVADREASIS